MNTYIETYQPFSGGPQMVQVIKPFTAEDFDIGDPFIDGAVEAHETYGKRGKRHVSGSRRLDMAETAFAALLDDLSTMWKDGTDFRGKEFKRRWEANSRAYGARTVPGFDETFADFTAWGISKRIELKSRSPKHETRQLEIDAMRERARREITSTQAVEDWLTEYNAEWQAYAKWSTEKLTEYVAELVKELRVKDEWIDEQMSQEDVDNLDAMNTEIESINEQVKVLNTRKVQLRESIYDRSRRVLETHLTNTQDPVLKAVFDAAIKSVKGNKPSMRSIFE